MDALPDMPAVRNLGRAGNEAPTDPQLRRPLVNYTVKQMNNAA
jgi:hypothetical protein